MIRSAGYCENYTICSCRPTHVGRGLKFESICYYIDNKRSPHAYGAWIEVKKRTKTNVPILVAPRMWGVD